MLGDTDGLQDVYEWEDQGVGSCTRPGGCIYLISSGQSARTDYLYAVSDSGDDVFFRTSDLLLAADGDATPSLYDARVGGGFPEAATPEECSAADTCRSPSAPPQLPNPASSTYVGGGNLPAAKKMQRCAKGKRKAMRLSRRAKAMRRAARRAKDRRRQKGLRHQAARSAKRAKRLSRKAKRCRHESRRVAR